MKGRTLWQPWASLVGIKLIETRGWYTPYRGLVAIHAAKRWNADLARTTATNCAIGEGLAALGFVLPAGPGRSFPLPLGAVVAVAELWDCEEMTAGNIASLGERERALGLYAPGRFMWKLKNVRRLSEPVPCKGLQKLWTLPADALQRVEAQLR